MAEPLFDTVALIGFGLIGSSLGRAIRAGGLARRIQAATREADAAAGILAAGLADSVRAEAAEAAAGADLVILATPLGTYEAIGRAIAPVLKPGCIVSDVGSVKQPVLDLLLPLLPEPARLIPGHPIAGTENSGWQSGFAALFQERWAILTPPPAHDPAALDGVRALWEGMGSKVDVMEARHHDRVLAITSHLPHLIAYTIVGTAADLEDAEQAAVLRYSASGFRDFTRIAASDPVMWRDVFLNNREAVLEILQRFTEDLTALQRAIRWGEGETLQALFTRTRAIRRALLTVDPKVLAAPDGSSR